MKTYEAMFLLDPSSADFETVSAPVRDLLDRIKAEVLVIKPWDERRLAYEIKGRRRGLYVLTYFKADPGEITNLNHEVLINEQVLRMMVLSGDHLSEENIQAETPATLQQARRAASEAEKAARQAEEAKQEPAAEAKAETPAETAETPAAPEAESGAKLEKAEEEPPGEAKAETPAEAAEPPAAPEADEAAKADGPEGQPAEESPEPAKPDEQPDAPGKEQA